jgi:type II secretory ATPase GspE/PulE/Tfp pilus assembly ATPase PilB-like protein
MTTATKTRARLGDLLVSRGVITREQLAHALDVQRQGQQEKLLGEILIDLEYATAEEILSSVAEGCGVPFAVLTPQLADPAVRDVLPEAFCQKHAVLPLFRVRNVLTVALSEPANVFLVDEIAHLCGASVQVVAATADHIRQMLQGARPGEGGGAATDVAPTPVGVPDEMLQPDDYESVYGNWPAEKVAALIVREALRSRASAIHLEPEERVVRVRFRIDGMLHVVMRPPIRLAEGLAAALGAFAQPPAPSQGPPPRPPLPGEPVQMHLEVLRGAFGPRWTIRLVREGQAQMALEKLGCDFPLLQKYRDLIAERRGLLVVAGYRDCGATTTLYSTLQALDPVRLNVCTYEGSVAYRLAGVNQFSPATTEVADAAEAVRRLLRHQPQVLMLDDCLAPAVAAVAVEAARDGCLVLARVRAADAAAAVARLAADVPPDDLVPALRGVLAQRLVRVVCSQCRTSYDPPAAVRRPVGEALDSVNHFVKGRGCPACRRTGFLGRIGLFELVPIEGAVAEAVRGGAGQDAVRQAARAAGCPSLWTDGIHKVRAGITSLEEVLAVLADCPGP